MRLSVEGLEDRCVPANLVVTSAANDGPGSLRAIIAAASDGDNIYFDPQLTNQTINLSSVIGTNLSLNITGTALPPQGGGPGQVVNTTISGMGTNGIFSFTGTTDTLSYLTLTNAVTDGFGNLHGAVYTEGSLTLLNDQFGGDRAAGDSNGAAVWDEAGANAPLTISGCTFAGNTGGRAVAVWGAPTFISDSTFTNNTGGAIGATPLLGGQSPLQITNSTFNSNSTSGSGGAIGASDYNISLISDTFRSNLARSGNGGAINASGSPGTTLTIFDSSFIGNQAFTGDGARSPTSGYGGAINTSDALYVTADGYNRSVFAGNTATSGGGAIDYAPVGNDNSQLWLVDSTFQNNSSEIGGAVYVFVNSSSGTVSSMVDRCLFQGNRSTGPADDLSYENGGGIRVQQGTSGTASADCTIQNSTFYQNGAVNYGGGLCLNSSNTGTGTNNLTLTSLTVAQNSAGRAGGGLMVAATAQLPAVGNSIIAGNTVAGPPANGADVRGDVRSLEYNLIGQTEGSTGWVPQPQGLPGGDLLGNSAAPLNPGLALAGPTNNGGFTPTIQLAPGSRAYQSGNQNLAGQDDQRNGRHRRSDPANNLKVSIGAYDPDAA